MLTGRGLRRATVVAAVAAVLLGVVPPGGAAAQDCDWRYVPGDDGNDKLVLVCGEEGSGGSGGGEWTCHIERAGNQIQVPCIHPVWGWFSETNGGCYIKPADPQPPPGDPRWNGHDPQREIFYNALCFAFEGIDGQTYDTVPATFFLPLGEGAIGDLLEQAIAELRLRGADIRIAPDPDGVGLVGLPVWMWTPQTVETWGPATASASALGVTLTAEANADRIVWDMGDGTQVACDDPGTPYDASYGAEDSPTCGHRYAAPSRSHPDGRYPVTATTEWSIDWWIEGTAITGTIPTTRTSDTSVQINELQVVTS